MGWLKYLLALFSACLLLLLGTELGLRLLFAVRDAGEPAVAERDVDPRALLPAYAGVDFDPAELWEEVRLGTEGWLSYAPYTVWTRRPVSGRYVNVEDDGLRRTINPSLSTEHPFEVWVFGGSTTWGIGAPDADTIPSLLSRELNAAGIPARVTNFGQTGFVSTQDHLALLRALQTRAAPDLVIMYEGANESLGLVDAPELINPHYLLDRIAGLFEDRPVEPAWRVLLRASASWRLARGLNKRLFGARARARPPRHDPEPAALAAREFAAWLRLHAAMLALAQAEGFELVAFWQPRLGVGNKPLHASERRLLREHSESAKQRFMLEFSRQQRRLLQARLANGGWPTISDLTDVFAELPQPLYVDWVHLAPAGNARIAKAMLARLRQRYCTLQPEPAALAGLCGPD